MLLGYARVSTDGQDLAQQRRALREAGCRRLYEEKLSGARRDRPELSRLLDNIREEDGCISFKELKADLAQYRALVMMGEDLMISSGSARVIADRHPDCSHDVIDQHQKRWRSEVRTAAHSRTRKHARDAARGTAELIKMLGRFQDDTERRVRERVEYERRITALLEQALEGTAMTERQKTLLNRLMTDKGVLRQVDWETTVVKLVRSIFNQRQVSDEQRALLDQVMRDEGIKAALEERRKPGADDLDRTETD